MCVCVFLFFYENSYFMGIAAHPKIFKTNQKEHWRFFFFFFEALAFVKLLSFCLPFARVQNVEGVGSVGKLTLPCGDSPVQSSIWKVKMK